MGDVTPIRPPHRLQLNHCPDCDAEVAAQWNLALRSRYDLDAEEEHTPRIDGPFEHDLDEDRY